jgi:hypothetical protein
MEPTYKNVRLSTIDIVQMVVELIICILVFYAIWRGIKAILKN